MHEEYKYYRKTHNNAWTTYFMFVLKYPALILLLFNIARLLDQNQKAGMKSNAGGLIVSYF